MSLPLKKGRASPKGKPCFPSMNFQGQARRFMERTVQDRPLPVMNRLNKFLISRVFWSKWKPFIIVRPSIEAPKLQPPIYKVCWPQLPIYKAICKGYLRRFLKKTWWGPSWKPTHAPPFWHLEGLPQTWRIVLAPWPFGSLDLVGICWNKTIFLTCKVMSSWIRTSYIHTDRIATTTRL